MKDCIKLFLYINILLITGLWAENDDKPVKFDFGGELEMEHRLDFTRKKVYFGWREYKLGLNTEIKARDRIRLYGDMWLRSLAATGPYEFSDLSDREKLMQVEINVKESYLDIYDIVIKGLDLRIGRQRIAWGTGDSLCPTDNLDAHDLEDFWDFGTKLASDGIDLSYSFNNNRFDIIFIPLFRPALLPAGNFMDMLSVSMIEMTGLNDLTGMMSGIIIGTTNFNIISPDQHPADSMTLAAKGAFSIGTVDLSLSYIYGRDSLPLFNNISMRSNEISTAGPMEMTVGMVYPRRHIAGADLAMDLFGIGIRGEAALFFPEDMDLEIDLSGIKDLLPTNLAISTLSSSLLKTREPYFHFMIGMDYIFANGIYINAQYLHGFIHERGKRNMEDYFFVVMNWNFLNDRLTLTPIGLAMELVDKDHFAFFYAPEISANPIDGLKITAGFRGIEGRQGTTIGSQDGLKEAYLKIIYAF